MQDYDNSDGGGGGNVVGICDQWKKEFEGVGNDGNGNNEERYQPRGRIICEEAKDIGERSATDSKKHLNFSNQACPFSFRKYLNLHLHFSAP